MYLIVLNQFSTFLSLYGDAPAYVVPKYHFDFWNYQPIWPYVAGKVNAHWGLKALFAFQAALYFASIVLIFYPMQRLYKFGGWLVAGFMLVNIRAYFYIANPLTETLNLFAFALTFFFWEQLRARRRYIAWFLAIALVAILFVRTANVAFIGALFMLVLVRALRASHAVERWQACLFLLLVLPALIAGVTYNVMLQGRPNNTGVNLLGFVSMACDQGRCPRNLGDPKVSPVASRYLMEHGDMERGALLVAFRQQGIDVWDPRLLNEMKAFYLRLLLTAPEAFISGGYANYKRQVLDTYVAPYLEDTNLAVRSRLSIGLMEHISTSVAMLVAALMPLLVLGFGVAILVARRFNITVVFVTAWLAAEGLTSQWLFGSQYISDASRMRLHYEIPGLILIIFTAQWLAALVRFRRPLGAL
ncbi:hypothetical protein [Dyella kyungheensis]|uniref:Glycosyltransferase RgtA/B/C/D-like domain-containing protein n=1 Tax=Dyella kyungheensis TaxID=1242174 RepID=A0ABS2JS13_9GAMM|nr:hypothetical protein [Dyella kyungheensis]MBM7121636.1 hypothetical protein [Dyella kyungheensis]